jgi:hypothetical protein
VSKTHVLPNIRPVAFLRYLPEVSDDQDIPMPVGTIDEMSGLRSTFKRTMLFDL